MIEIYDVTINHQFQPIGIDGKGIRFSWKLRSSEQDTMQQSYQILCSEDKSFLESAMVWDSGKIDSPNSQNIRYEGEQLRSSSRIYCKIICCTNKGAAESEITFFETGLLHRNDWCARWIEPEQEVDPDQFKPAPYLRKTFMVRKDLVRARAYFTAKGLYHFYLNGKEGTKTLFNPGYTSYYHNLYVQTYDITQLLRQGENALGVILGDGWWRGGVGVFDFRNNFGYKLGFLGQILLEYKDGSTEIIGTDKSFLTSEGEIRKSDLKCGEVFEERIDFRGWNCVGFDDTDWQPVTEYSITGDHIKPERRVPVCRKESFQAQIIQTPNGQTVLDFGQNIAGWVEMNINLKSGDSLRLQHGEILDAAGNFTVSNLLVYPDQAADFQTITYCAAAEGIRNYHPHFCIFGFRYVLVEGELEQIRAEDFTAYAIYSDLKETGTFHCSNPLLGQLVSNSRWSQKGNFMDVPTDCPTRERAGWTGDAQLYCSTAAKFMDVYAFFEKWMLDLTAEQYENGSVPITIPGVDLHSQEEYRRQMAIQKETMFPLVDPKEPGFVDGSAGWGDAAVIIPWTLYQIYGDPEILMNQYQSAKAWVDYMIREAKESNPLGESYPFYHNQEDYAFIWDTKFHFGEWLEADVVQIPGHEDPEAIYYDRMLVATSYYAYSSGLLSKMAGVLGNQADAEYYSSVSESVKRVFQTWLIPRDGKIRAGRQAPHVRALAFDLVSSKQRQPVAEYLNQLVLEADSHLNTGFLSTPFLLKVLADHGYLDTAYALLEQTSCPSWLYAVRQGATSVWESWDAVKEDGSITGSLNHYAYGAVCDFLFEQVAGIRRQEDQTGFARILLEPLTGGTLTWAEASYDSPYGEIFSRWAKVGEQTKYTFRIPPNTRAQVRLQCLDEQFEKIDRSFFPERSEDGKICLDLLSGEHIIMI